MKLEVFIIVLFFSGIIGCVAQKPTYSYKSETLKIQQISENSFLHISYLVTEDFGNVACNGMIVIDNGEALIIDTPANDSTTKELINYVQNNLDCELIGVVATHFHIDCLGGLNEFHKRQIPSYANKKTIHLARLSKNILPLNVFDDYLEIQVGNKNVVNEYLGEGHTKDNIISYFHSERVLFGGCLVKEVGAGKGNLEDANIHDWSNTVRRVKTKYSNAEIIVPGHGKYGGHDLLNYTIELFNKE